MGFMGGASEAESRFFLNVEELLNNEYFLQFSPRIIFIAPPSFFFLLLAHMPQRIKAR